MGGSSVQLFFTGHLGLLKVKDAKHNGKERKFFVQITKAHFFRAMSE